jgi:N-acetylglucosamine kinase-like BadF-type ATPase
MNGGSGDLVVGVDAGGTKTDVHVVDRTGAVVGAARGPGANHESIGHAAAEGVLGAVLADALTAAGATPARICASAWALAGLYFPSDERMFGELPARLGLPGPAVVVNDVHAAMRAGLDGPGVAVVAGTGLIAAGRDAGGRTWRTLGLSTGPGDWGGGPEVVRAAVHAVAQSAMGLGPTTALADVALERTGAVDVPGWLEGAFRRGLTGLTPHDVWQCAASGDPVADALADAAASSYATAAAVVAQRLRLENPVDVVLAGRVLDPGHPLLHDRLTAALATSLPGAVARRLGRRPVEGAVLLARDAAGW